VTNVAESSETESRKNKVEDINLPVGDKELDFFTGQKKPQADGSSCLVLKEHFSEDTERRQARFQCVMCVAGAHNDCTVADEDWCV
jgi:hypothetical protein